MNHSMTNDQHLLAEQVVLNDMHSNHASYEAMLKIQRWKFILKIPGIATRIADEANESIKRNFLTFISNKLVLSEQPIVSCNAN